jgi:hypothetical protein
MRLKKIPKFFIPTFLAVAFFAGVYLYLIAGRPAPVPVKEKLATGVTYKRMVRYFPHAMIAHVLIVDKKTSGLYFFVTPPDDVEGGAVKARTTSQFLSEFDMNLAINGDGFFPWWSRSPADYYPHVGDPVTPNGYAAWRGKVYARGLQDPTSEPTLYISRQNDLAFNIQPTRVFHAISGDRMLLQGGNIIAGLDDTESDPRTAIGINNNGRWVYLVVVDGRQPFYSAGATFQELAELLKSLGASYAMSLDGGGSSTMVMAGENGEPVILNSPVDNYIPLRERAVANHFGVYIKK